MPNEMFGDFDPYLELTVLQNEVANQGATINKLIHANNKQAEMLKDISEQFVKLTEQNLALYRMLGEIQANEVK